MAKRNHIYTTEELVKFRLADTTPRKISTKEKVDVLCSKCMTPGHVLFREVAVRGLWSCKSCGLTGIKKSYRNGKPSIQRKWTEQELQDRNIQDATSRAIKAADRVAVFCASCHIPGEAIMNNVNSSLRDKGYGWRCAACFSTGQSALASSRNLSGENNPFYGHRHTAGTRQVLSSLAVARCEEMTKGQRTQISKIRSDGFKAKYGVDNPMQIPEFKNKHKAAHAEWFESRPPHTRYSSKGELELKAWVDSLGFQTEKYRSGGKEIDIFIPELKLGIEYNGLYWHSEDSLGSSDYHLQKTCFFEEQGIRVIHIFEHEWNTRKTQTQGYLRSVFSLNTEKIGARKCLFREANRTEASHLLEYSHIQGSSRGSIYFLGAYYEDELVAVCSFSKHHRNNTQIVLNRFCCKPSFTISGALSKFSKMASAHFKQDIISWADIRFSKGGGYKAAGWELEAVLSPDYFYANRNGQVFSKQSRKKSAVNTPIGMTESEHAKKDGLFRVWDCGKLRFVYRF